MGLQARVSRIGLPSQAFQGRASRSGPPGQDSQANNLWVGPQGQSLRPRALSQSLRPRALSQSLQAKALGPRPSGQSSQALQMDVRTDGRKDRWMEGRRYWWMNITASAKSLATVQPCIWPCWLYTQTCFFICTFGNCALWAADDVL